MCGITWTMIFCCFFISMQWWWISLASHGWFRIPEATHSYLQSWETTSTPLVISIHRKGFRAAEVITFGFWFQIFSAGAHFCIFTLPWLVVPDTAKHCMCLFHCQFRLVKWIVIAMEHPPFLIGKTAKHVLIGFIHFPSMMLNYQRVSTIIVHNIEWLHCGWSMLPMGSRILNRMIKHLGASFGVWHLPKWWEGFCLPLK